MTAPLDEKGLGAASKAIAGDTPMGQMSRASEIAEKAIRTYLSAAALPDELEVVAWQDEGDLTFPLVRLQDAAHALFQAHSTIAALRRDHELVVTLRNQVEAAHRQLDAAEAQVKRLTEENEALRGLLFRYRNETTLGHQPHMIAAEVDQALSGSKE